jgi:hypothetical protein
VLTWVFAVRVGMRFIVGVGGRVGRWCRPCRVQQGSSGTVHRWTDAAEMDGGVVKLARDR